MNKQEIEIKLPVEDTAAMRRRLRRMGARAVRRVHEMNTLFDTPRETLRKQGRLLRLRIETPARTMGLQAEGADAGAPLGLRIERPARSKGPPTALLTFKGPSKRGGLYKVRSECEMPVAQPELLTEILKAAGLRPTFRYEKIRSSFGIRRMPRLHLELDETPIGVYLELEGTRRAIDRMAKSLGFSPADYITKSYLGLHLDACRRKGVPAGDLVFRARKK